MNKIFKKICSIISNVKKSFGVWLWRFLDFESQSLNASRDAGLTLGVNAIFMNGIKGDYTEFGVMAGRSFSKVYSEFETFYRASDRKFDMNFWAFDSFEGLPDSDEDDKPDSYSEGAYACSKDQFLTNLKNNNVDLSQVKTVQGFYNESLKNQELKHPDKIAMAYIDCDLYTAAKDVFHYLTDKVDTGSVIIIDDFYRHTATPETGIQKAMYEWLQENKDINLVPFISFERVSYFVQRIK